eukprot:TRINITY_DN40950_c0_g1_i1.p1 TRINITY_DN40950_c0_g1~~TRINITY_DN40950_c0_g1_i1.p1  ORF type:complete len:343 (+),score=8.56 TRINITY_DN40950_c0_g1_i1:58-1086(+)
MVILSMAIDTLLVHDRRTWCEDPFCVGDLRTFRDHWRQLAIAFSVFLVGTYADSFGQARVQRTAEFYLAGTIWSANEISLVERVLTPAQALNAQRSVFLYDEGHRHLPHIDPAWCDRLATLGQTLVWMRFIILPGPRSIRWLMLRRLYFLTGFISLFRSLTVQCTVLPNPDLNCKPVLKSPDNVWLEAFWVMIQIDTTCQDVLFSGHTCCIALACLMWGYYAPYAPLRASESGRMSKWCVHKILAALYLLVGMFVIVGSRFHYTDDVLIGAFVCCSIFCTYHMLLRLAPYHREDGVMWRLLLAFEDESPDMKMRMLHATSLPALRTPWSGNGEPPSPSPAAV